MPAIAWLQMDNHLNSTMKLLPDRHHLVPNFSGMFVGCIRLLLILMVLIDCLHCQLVAQIASQILHKPVVCMRQLDLSQALVPNHPISSCYQTCKVPGRMLFPTTQVELKNQSSPKELVLVVGYRKNNDRYHARHLINFHCRVYW